jgi:diguanylate cyclase (GGDEF)-like protein
VKSIDEERRPPEADQLHKLLALARELFQTDDTGYSLALLGSTLCDMLRPDTALLLLRGARLDAIGFDARGTARRVGAEHPLYDAGMSLLSDVTRPAGAGNGHRESVSARMLALALPAQDAVACLAVAWHTGLDLARRESGRRAMLPILELGAAALGKIDARSALERLVDDQQARFASTSQAHAAELAQRDEAAVEMRMLSLTDVLTGLYNRRGFFLQAEQVFKVARRKRARSAVIFADIDGLKNVNDELGHDAGDRLICDAALVFRQSFRQADVVARLGGDEFAAFTLDDEQPAVILQRIQANLRAFNLTGERPYPVAISMGVVQCDPWGEPSLSHYLVLADELMYRHKRRRLH